DDLFCDRAARRIEDQVDQSAVLVPGLVEPAFGRPVRLPACAFEGVERGIGVLELDEEVDVVLRLRTAAGPGREAAAEDERDPAFLQDSRTGLHRLDQLFERCLEHVFAVSGWPVGATSSA